MKKVYKHIFLFAFLITFTISCENEDAKIINIDQFSNSGKILNLEYFKTKGFKEVKKYDVSGLSGALSAHYGWYKDTLNNPRDYELRFYKDHESALSSKKIVEEVIGENAILATRDVTWKEGNSDRRVNRRGAGSGPGSAKAKYLYYLIYENTVIMCEGLNEEESMKLCNDLVK